MSRKWERMVNKNKKVVNNTRSKAGKKKIDTVETPDFDEYKGRSIFFPILFMSISLMFLFVFDQTETGVLYWVTIVSYFLLSLYFFFLKRPYLRVSKAQISTRKFGRDRPVPAAEIEKITIQSAYILIKIKGKKNPLMFSKLINRFDLTAMASRLKEFAAQHSISYKIEY